MLVTPIQFAATLTAKLEADERRLPLTEADNTRLTAAIADGNYTYLVLRDPTGAEIVKLEHTCGTLLITRGEDGTDARAFPRGSCVRFETTPAIVKDLVCNYDCCEQGCACNPVEASGITVADGTVGTPWTGVAIFSGDTPMELAVTGLPSWASFEIGPNFLKFSGTPTGAGSFPVSVAATNCDGSLAVQQATINIT